MEYYNLIVDNGIDFSYLSNVFCSFQSQRYLNISVELLHHHFMYESWHPCVKKYIMTGKCRSVVEMD